MPETAAAHLVFTGPTPLARAFCALEQNGFTCAIVSAPAGGSPCGLALAVRPDDLARVLEVLGALGVKPHLPTWSGAATPAPGS